MARISKTTFVVALAIFAAPLFQRGLKAQANLSSCPSSIAGRYSLTLGEWSRPLGANAPYHAIPGEIVLDTAAASRGGWKVSPDIKYPFPHRFPGTPRWTISHDTVQVVWSNGFQPTIVTLVQGGDNTLIGKAVVRSDANEYGTDLPHAAVVARRIACISSQ